MLRIGYAQAAATETNLDFLEFEAAFLEEMFFCDRDDQREVSWSLRSNLSLDGELRGTAERGYIFEHQCGKCPS
jgi:hypothetical protein